MEKHKVFVYGTLRVGQGNFNRYMAGAVFYGKGKTAFGAELYGEFGIPYAKKTKSATPVVGELYGVNDAELRLLDRLEGHPRVYRREMVPVLVGGNVYMAWMYFYTGKVHGLPYQDFVAYREHRKSNVFCGECGGPLDASGYISDDFCVCGECVAVAVGDR